MLPSELDCSVPCAPTAQRGYYVYVTLACNLRCDYCFIKHKDNKRHMSEELAAQTADWICADPVGQKKKYVQFFGGEPLLNTKAITILADKTLAWAATSGCEVKFGLTTNGTLLNPDNIALIKKYKIGIQFSCDGGQKGHDTHRKFVGGGGSFDKLHIKEYLENFGTNARMTITDKNVYYLSDSLKQLTGLGFASFSLIPDFLGSWSRFGVECYRREMDKILEWYLPRRGKVQLSWVVNFRDKTLNPNVANKGLCAIGHTLVSVSPEGFIWPCHDVLGQYDGNEEKEREFILGHISRGHLYRPQLKPFLELRSFPDSAVHSAAGYNCDVCWARGACSSGCTYINIAGTGKRNVVPKFTCIFTRLHTDFVLRLHAIELREAAIKRQQSARGKMQLPSSETAQPKPKKAINS